uniref:Reverse transcriptase domain-containing protein n=1 Tax=Tanacetum cinerariifolium TaxID=118510 RepID=A0A6L2JLT0_TANCI|nr:reverse transcriptase domain-containing protein [Tanacetum cinerariifolium]
MMEVFMDDFLVFGNSFKSCLSHLDKMLKWCEDTNLFLNWEKCHFIVKEGIVLDHKISKNGIEVDKARFDVIAKLPHLTTVKDHSAIKYLFNKQDAKQRLLGWVLLMQEFDITVRDKKGAENLAANHLSQLENPHQSVLDKKEINEMFPLETLNMVSFRGDSSSPWKPLTFSRLATMDPPRDIMARTTPPNRFGTPYAIISDHGTHFCNDQFAKVMLKYGVTHRLATAYHPQTSRQVEVSNRGLKRILERPVDKNRASWLDKLNDALWAFRTAFKTPIRFQLNELNELRDQAYENSLIYKEKTKRLHDSKMKDRIFNVGNRVLLFNSRLNIFLGNLKTHCSGPFTITHVFPYGTIELSQTDGPNFKVNGYRLKHYFEEDIPKMVVSDL